MRDPYVYKNTNVLINKKNYTNLQDLENYETAISTLNMFRILTDPPNKFIDLEYIYNIHYRLFCDVYYWSGQPRIINMYKNEPVLNGLSVEYAEFSDIRKLLTKLNKQFKSENWATMKKKILLKRICFYLTEVWKIHAFREGNTRTVFVLLILLLKQYKIKIDDKIISNNAKYFRNALVLASLGQYAEDWYLEKILGDSIKTKSRNITSGEYMSINGYELNKYQYSQHKIK